MALTKQPSTTTDQKALATICQNVTLHHIPLLEEATSAKEAWEVLKALAGADSNA
jgi:hypothetical protein